MNKFKTQDFSDDVLKLIYGENIDINEVRKIKDGWYWDDLVLYLSGNNILKINDIMNMSYIDVLKFLENQITNKSLPKYVYNPPAIGFKINK